MAKLLMGKEVSARIKTELAAEVKKLKEQGIKQAVLSATEREMLEGQLNTLGIRDFFEEVMGLDNIHAGSKLFLADDWRERHPDSRVIFVGDTDHDVQTASALGADCVLICRGHQSKEYLKTLNVPVYDDLSEIFQF